MRHLENYKLFEGKTLKIWNGRGHGKFERGSIEIHLLKKHIGQIMFRKEFVSVKKMGEKFPKEFKYTELGNIKSVISSIIKDSKNVNESYLKNVDKVRLNTPGTIFVKSKRHLRDIIITKETPELIFWKENKNKDFKEGKVSKDVSENPIRLVEVTYGDTKMNAVAIGYASGPYYKEVYYILNEIKYDNADFDKVDPLDPVKLINDTINNDENTTI